MKEPRPLRELLGATDWLSVGLVGVLFLVGVVTIWSAAGGGSRGLYFAGRQLAFGGVALVGIALLWLVDFDWICRFSPLFYLLGCLVLVALLGLGYVAKGAQSWMNIGAFRFQPSEFVKPALALFLAAWCTTFEPQNLKGFLSALALGLVGAALVLVQPDLGSALVYGVITFTALAVAGAPAKYLWSFVGLGVAALPLGWFALLKPYQQNRLLVFIDPTRDPLGAGYNVIQSRIAVGSGGLLGKGLMMGTQSKLRFLPEPHTDFIFSVFGEEFGFFGCVVLLLLFTALFWRLFSSVLEGARRRDKIFVASVAFWVWFQFFEGVAMSMGLMPVTGLPLPLLSYGGSALLSTLITLGLCIKVGALAKLKTKESNVVIDRLPQGGRTSFEKHAQF